ncbi:DUF6049 family protein [Kitasatospora sp. NPDC006697]|uniref:DUF6049 family protein n=1 Tax=Kitasatospora sp. NPDC006697 TaxID=3364020 RepID=UPI0036CD7510
MGEPARHTEVPRGTGRGRRWPLARRGAALATGLLALLGGLAAPGATAAPSASPDFPATVTITAVKQNSTAANGTLQVSGSIANSGSSPLKSLQVGLALGRGSAKEKTRSDIQAMLNRTDPIGADGHQVPGTTRQLPDLGPGATTTFDLPAVQLSDLKLEGNGVYELAVDVEAGTADDSDQHTVGIARSTLPYYPAPAGEKQLQTAVLWPLTHAPELVPQTSGDNDALVLRDDSLVGELAPGGRLYQLVKTGSTVPNATWVVDPDLLDAVLAMTKPYRVQSPGSRPGQSAQDGNTTAGIGTAVANDWLNLLRSAVTAAGASVVALPYGDPDLASIAHANGKLADAESVLATARTAGTYTAEGRLSVDVRSDIAWPYQGYLDPSVQQVSQQLGASVLLVNGASVPDPASLSYTPNAARPIGHGQTAVAADPTVAGLFQGDLKSADVQMHAQQRFLAETLQIQQQQPNQQRTLLVMPPRDLTADTAKVLADSLNTAKAGGWLSPVPLNDVVTAPADPKAGSAVAGPDSYPGDLRGSELPAAAFDQVGAIQDNEAKLLRIVTIAKRVSGPFTGSLDRSLSTQWRTAAKAGQDYRTNAEEYSANLVGAVLIPPKSKTITLAGDSGVLQVSVRNTLQQTVTNLELRLTSAQPNRLKVTSRQSITLDAAQSTSARFQAQALGNGSVQLTAQLFTVGPDGEHKYSEAQTFTVQVTQVTSGVWWVVGAGAALVLVAGLRILLQRRKRGYEPPEDPDAPLSDPDAPQGGEQAEPSAEDSAEDPFGPLPGHSADRAEAHP